MRDFFRALTPMAWAAIAVVVLAIVLLTLSYCSAKDRAAVDAVEAGAASTFAEGRAAAGADAVGVAVDNAARSDAIDDRVKGSEDAIRNVPPAERDGAAVRELCRSPSAARRPECAVQRPGP